MEKVEHSISNSDHKPDASSDVARLDKDIEKFKDINESKVIRKVDLKLIFLLFLLYFFSYLDRNNLSFSRELGILEELNMNDSQYNWCFTIFSIGYFIFEFPSNMIMKKATAPKWFARIMVTWGAVTIGNAFVKNFDGMAACRFLLGAFEAGLFPGIIYYLSFWYKRKEIALRIALVSSAPPLSMITSAFIATGMLYLQGEGGLTGWRWMFIIEGIPTVLLGAATWFLLPSIPSKAKFLSQDEKDFMVDRLLDDFTDSDTTKFDWKQIKEAAMDLKVWMFMLVNITVSTGFSAVIAHFPRMIYKLGFSKSQAYLLTIPPPLGGAILQLIWAFHSDKRIERCFHFCFPIFLIVIGFIINLASSGATGKYIGLFLALTVNGSYYPILQSWLTNNIVGSTKMGIVAAMMTASASIGSAIGPHIYRDSDSPKYIKGNTIVVCIFALTILLCLLLRYLLQRENRKLDALSNESQTEARADGFDTSKFRYTL